MAYFPTATQTYATLPSARSVVAGDFYLTKDAGEVWSDGSQWNVVAGTFPVSTFALLPTIPTLPVGVIAVTTDLGLVVSTGTGGWSVTGTAPAVLTAAGIQAAINAVSAAGGGVVQLPGVNIPLSASVAMASGVTLRGVAPQLVYNTIPDSGLTTLTGSVGGTVLSPTGAFPAITWNTATLGAPASQTAFSQLALTNICIRDIGFNGGTYGIFAGGTNNASCWYSQFFNLYFTGQTVVGLSITNYQHCQFRGNYSFGCAWGQYHGIDVASTSLAPGNSTYYDLYNCNPTGSGTNATTARGITFLTTATTGGAADNNEFKFDRIQSNRFGGTTITQAATMVNTQTTFTVTDGTKFPVGMPVTFSAAANGFLANKTYFVVTNAANVISVALTYGGAAIAATGATAVNVITQGFPCFEMIALAGSAQTNMVIDNLDVEGLATCAILVQNCNGVQIRISQVPGTAQAAFSATLRGVVNWRIDAPQSINTDNDNTVSGNAGFFYGARFGTSAGVIGGGLWYDSVSGKTTLSLGSQFDTAAAGALTLDPATAGGFIAPRVNGIGQMTKAVNGTLTITNLNLQYTNNTSAAVMTLPTVGAANNGAWLELYNPTAGTQTINTDGAQLFNGIAGRTGLTLNAGATVRLSATANPSTWTVVGGSSAMVAGVISAPS